ncbi:MAG: hypothetical protein ACI9W4_000873 [Rhodothermales bacterium]|jgi:hypothetical protein
MLGSISNAPQVARTTALLDAKHMVENPVVVFERYRARLGPTFSFHFGEVKPAIVSTDPEFIRHVLKTNHDNYVKSHIQTKHMVEFQGVGLVNSHGDKWLRQRKLVARGFLPRRLADMLPMQIEVLDRLLLRFEADVAKGPVDVHEHMVRFTLGMVGRSIFGRAAKDAELQHIADAISDIQAYIVEMIVQPYLATFNLKHVTLETSPIRQLVPAGVAVESGTVYDLDVLVFATGFQTTEKGNQPTFRLVGCSGVELNDFWDQNRFQCFARIAVSGFPNLFLTAGPYSGGFNWFAMLETHLHHIMGCLDHAWATGQRRVEVNANAYQDYVATTYALADRTVFKAGQCATARSYYVDRNGDASLHSQRTPFERNRDVKARGVTEFDFD